MIILSNLINYVKENKDKTFKEYPFNEIDAAIYTALSYIDFSGIITDKMTIKEAYDKTQDRFLLKSKDKFKEQNRALFKELASSNRFKDNVITSYKRLVNNYTQFGAITIVVPKHFKFIAFEGTEDELVGWEENFKMAYMYPVPAHEEAITYLKENISKVKGFVITHGHEDHIGALPYVLKEVNVPIYATKLTIGLIENKLKEHNLLRTTKRKVIRHGQSINLGCFRIEFIKTNHSIQDASALAIYSPAGIVVHTGDFKVDYTPVFGDAIDLQRFAEIGKKGVLALMCDSTNAERKGFTMSERTVGRTFDNIFAEHRNTRIIIATFASNVDRVQQIINSAYKYGRKVAVEGRSMVNVIGTAAELGYLKIPDKTLIDIDQLKNYPDEKVVLITTGSQGESMAALSRMAASIHKKVTIKPNDTIIFSSNPIPGNEKAVSKVINELSMKGADVIFQDAHVSGHACQEEIKLIYSLVKPKYAIPVHGEYRHLKAQAGVAEELGIPKENIFILSSGDVLELNEEEPARVTGQVRTGAIFVDGLGDVGNIVLRDRQHLSEDGIMIVVLTLEKHSSNLLAGPDIVSRGFVYVRESEDLMEEARSVVEEAIDSCLERHITDWGKMKNVIKDSLGEFLWKRTKRSPMILPIIMEA